MLFNFFKKKKANTSKEENFIDPINPDDFGEEDVIISNVIANYPIGYQNREFVLKKWLLNEGDFVRKGQALFELSIEKENYDSIPSSGNSPINGIIIKRISENIVLRENQNCCVVKPVSDLELEKYYYDFTFREREVDTSRVEYDIFLFDEISTNEHKGTASIKLTRDEFSDKIEVETFDTSSESFKKSISLSFAFLNKNSENYLILKTYRKHFKLKEGSLVHILFADNSKFCIELGTDGERFDKDSNGVIFINFVELSSELLDKFASTPFKKWKLVNASDGQEILGGKMSEYWGIDYSRRKIMLKARAFQFVINKNGI